MSIAAEKIENEDFVTSMSIKGQVVISKDIRIKLGLKPRDKFTERVKNNRIILERVPSVDELKTSWKKAMKGRTTKQIMKGIDEGWNT